MNKTVEADCRTGMRELNIVMPKSNLLQFLSINCNRKKTRKEETDYESAYSEARQ
jgi:hypothetical protein